MDPDDCERSEPDEDELDAAFGDLTDEQLAGVDVVQAQIDEINAIPDDAERKTAAKAWTARLTGT